MNSTVKLLFSSCDYVRCAFATLSGPVGKEPNESGHIDIVVEHHAEQIFALLRCFPDVFYRVMCRWYHVSDLADCETWKQSIFNVDS